MKTGKNKNILSALAAAQRGVRERKLGELAQELKETRKIEKLDRGLALKGSEASNLAPVSINVPMPKVSFTRRSAKNYNNDLSIRCFGTDLVNVVVPYDSAVSNSNSPGYVMLNQDLGPGSFVNTSLAIESQLWDQYWCRRLSATYRPAVGTDQPGSVFMYFDWDAKEIPDDGNGAVLNLTSAASHPTYDCSNVWRPFSIHGSPPQTTPLYVRPQNDDYWSTPGNLLVGIDIGVNTSATGIASGQVIGQIYITYEYVFVCRSINPGVGNQMGVWKLLTDATSTPSDIFTGIADNYKPFGANADPGNTAVLTIKPGGQAARCNFTGLDVNKSYVFAAKLETGTISVAGTMVQTSGSAGTTVGGFTTFVANSKELHLVQFQPGPTGIFTFTITEDATTATASKTMRFWLSPIPHSPTFPGIGT